MNYARGIKVISLLVVMVMFVGCKSRQDKPGAGTQDKAAASAQGKASADAVSPKDKSEARAAAAQVLSQFVAGEFPAIYKESAPGFKQIGNESQFVAKFQHTRQTVGALKNPHEVSFNVGPEKSNVLVYRLENDRFKTDIRLTFVRSPNGKMELAGLNQHDEPKK
jgi:hypothetical protein